MRAVFFFLTLFAISGSSQAQVYKWVDEKGVTHYGAEPPKKGRSSEVNIKSQPALSAAPSPVAGATGGAAVTAGAPKTDWAAKDAAFKQRQTEREQAEAKALAEANVRKGECVYWRDRVRVLRDSPRHYGLNDKGERVYRTDAEREANIAKADAEVKKNC